MRINKSKIIISSLLVVLLIFGFFYVWYTWNTKLEEKNETVIKIAQISESALNGEMFKQLRGIPEDVGTLPYESIKKRLTDLTGLIGDVRFAYIYTQKNNRLYFLVDSEPITSEDYSYPGQEYSEAKDEYKQPFRDGKYLITPPSTDRWGTWVSVLVPMNDYETGKVSAVFALDFPAEEWNSDALYHSFQAGYFVLFLFLLMASFYIIIRINSNLKESEKKYRLIIENSYDIIYKITEDGQFTFVSPAWTKLLGHKIKDVIGQHFQKFIHPDDVSIYLGALQLVNESKKQQESVEYRVMHIDGSWRWHVSNISPIKNEKGVIYGFYGIARDITESKKAMEGITQLNKYMVGRELKMIELKKRINKLEKIDK